MTTCLNSATQYYVSKLAVTHTAQEARDKLTNWGFVLIGSGSESDVYSRTGFDYVIKVMRKSHYGLGAEVIRNLPCEKHFAKSFVYDTNGLHKIIIQEKLERVSLPIANAKINNLDDFFTMIGRKFPKVEDIAYYNVGKRRDGRYQVIDCCINGLSHN